LSTLNAININKHISVLYVEDKAEIRDELFEILSLYLDEVYTATNGKEGFEQFREHRPDLIITDIQMPIMSGLDMIEKIRQEDQNIPIIVTSAFNETSYLLKAIDLGVEHYLLKPIMIERLQTCLNKVSTSLIQERELKAYQLYLEERVQEEKSLREAEESLLIEKNKSYEVGQMVSVIAHQWKQPLHYLNLLIEDLGMEYDYQPLSAEYIKDFVKNGTARVSFLTETMDNFLNFYKTNPNKSDFSVSGVIKEISLFLEMSYQSQGIKIEMEIENDFSLHGIENEFQQVILNLINNAKEAFHGQKRADSIIKVCLKKDMDKGKIIISDNAGGIQDEFLQKVFDLEFTTKDSGNGIGLYLVKKIVQERFNGNIDVSNNALGAEFELVFTINEGDLNV